MAWSYRSAMVILTVISFPACDSTTDPEDTQPPPGGLLRPNDTVSATLDSDSGVSFAFHAQAQASFALFFEAVEGGQEAVVGDTTGAVLAAIRSSAGGVPLDMNATPVFLTRVSGTHRIDVRSTASGVTGRFRLWLYPVSRLPEVAGQRVTAGDTIAEVLETIRDVDEFVFHGETGQDLNVFLQALGQSSGQLALLVEEMSVVVSTTADSALQQRATGPFTLPATGDHSVTVSSIAAERLESGVFRGPYRFQVVAIDPAPELAAASVAPGDTVSGESIDPLGDVDEFTISASAGTELNVFVQATSGSPSDLLYVDVPGVIEAHPAAAQSIGSDTGLTQHATGRFFQPAGAPAVVRVRGAHGGSQGDRGPYRLFLYGIDRRPETAGAAITLGDSVVGETIELPGDIDEYTLVVPEATLANIVVHRDTAPTDALTLAGTACTMTVVAGPGQGCRVSVLPAGRHPLSLAGMHSFGFGYRGGYRLHMFAIDTLPEGRSDTVAMNDVVDEALLPIGDVDVFVSHWRKGQHIDIYVEPTGEPTEASPSLSVFDPATGSVLAVATTPVAPPASGDWRTGRFDALSTGWHPIRVSPQNGGFLLQEKGPYRFWIAEVAAHPETASPFLQPGDSLNTERLDDLEDVDAYVINGTAGQELAVFLHARETEGLTVAVYDTATGDFVASTPSFIALESTGRFSLPPTGVLGLRVYSPRPCPPELQFCGIAFRPGAYFVWVYTVNRAPEFVPATVAFGDTVAGESIEPSADIDEFSFSGTAGQRVNAFLQTPFGSTQSPGVMLEVVDPLTDSVLGSVASNNPTNLEDQATGEITLPRMDSYVIRVRAAGERRGSAIYRFKLVNVT